MSKIQRETKTHLFSQEGSSKMRVLTYAGAIMAFLIGSGFATGQEIMQYYTSYGFWGLFGTGAIVLALISFVSIQFLTVGRREQFEKPSQIFEYYGGEIRWEILRLLFHPVRLSVVHRHGFRCRCRI